MFVKPIVNLMCTLQVYSTVLVQHLMVTIDMSINDTNTM